MAVDIHSPVRVQYTMYVELEELEGGWNTESKLQAQGVGYKKKVYDDKGVGVNVGLPLTGLMLCILALEVFTGISTAVPTGALVEARPH